MNWKKFVLTFVVIFLVVTALGYIIHAVLLAQDYQSVSHLYRGQPLMPFLMLGQKILAEQRKTWKDFFAALDRVAGINPA